MQTTFKVRGNEYEFLEKTNFEQWVHRDSVFPKVYAYTILATLVFLVGLYMIVVERLSPSNVHIFEFGDDLKVAGVAIIACVATELMLHPGWTLYWRHPLTVEQLRRLPAPVRQLLLDHYVYGVITRKVARDAKLFLAMKNNLRKRRETEEEAARRLQVSQRDELARSLQQ